MNEHLGWRQGSEMPSIYVHLSGRDVDKALLRISGLEVEDEEKREEFVVRLCPRCNGRNSPGSSFCGKCGLPLFAQGVAELSGAETAANRVVEALAGRIQTVLRGELALHPDLLGAGKPSGEIFDALRLSDKVVLSAVQEARGPIFVDSDGGNDVDSDIDGDVDRKMRDKDKDDDRGK